MRPPIVHLGLACGLLLGTVACARRPPAYEGSPSRGQMITHFDLAVEARRDVITGDLDHFHGTVRDLAELEPAEDLPAEIILQLGPMRWEAREAVLARTLADAALGAARIAATCGDCHLANGDPLSGRFTIGGPPPPGSPARHMAGLAWASRLLWDGIIGPSDETWAAGSQAIVELGVLPEGLSVALDPAVARMAGARLQRLGTRAALLRSREERVEVAAEIWTECADCHSALAPSNPPSERNAARPPQG